MGLYDFSYLKRNGKYLTRNNKILYTYARGLYSIEEIDALIAEGYIPVATADELDGLRHSSQRVMGSGTIWEGLYFTGLDKKYVQVGDIDLVGFANWTSINGFNGIFDGNELVIDNMRSRTDEFTGLFSVANIEAKLKNIRLSNIDVIVSTTDFLGGLVGQFWGETSEIDNCTVTGSIENTTTTDMSYGTGGLVGWTHNPTVANGPPTVKNSISYVNVTGRNNTGGFAGRLDQGIFDNCKAYGNVIAYGNNSGGLTGAAANTGTGGSPSSVTNCYAYGNVSTPNDSSNIGGFAGVIRCAVSKCAAYGDVLSGERCGGFIGLGFTGGNISDCFAHGNATNTGTGSVISAGGFVGWHRCPISNSYSIGVPSSDINQGGFAGLLGTGGTTTNSYYDTDTSLQSDTDKGEPRTTLQLQQGTQDSFILPAGGIDPSTLAANAVYTGWSTAIWRFDPKNKYPRLK